MSVSVIFEEICTFVLNWAFSAFLSWAIPIVLGINTVPFLTITSQGFSTTTLFPVRAPRSFFFLGGATPLALALDRSMDVTWFTEWTFNFMQTKDTFIVVGTCNLAIRITKPVCCKKNHRYLYLKFAVFAQCSYSSHSDLHTHSCLNVLLTVEG